MSDAVALAAVFGGGATIGIGIGTSRDPDILAPASLGLQLEEAAAALKTGRPQIIFSFGNTEAGVAPDAIGPVMELLAAGSGAGFLCACFAAPWMGTTVYQGHLFRNGVLCNDLRRDLAHHIDGAIGIVSHDVVAAGAKAISRQLTVFKEQGIRLALIDAIAEGDCTDIAGAVSRQPIVAGPAWLRAAGPASHNTERRGDIACPVGPLAILSGALHRQTLMQTAAARHSMPVLDLDFKNPDPPEQVARALAFARPWIADTPFLITSASPPDRLQPGFPAAEVLAAIALALRDAGIRNFLLNGNDTAATILRHLGVTWLSVDAAFAGLHWLRTEANNFLIKPGGFGPQNLFLYEFEPQSRLNEPAE